MPSSSKKQHNFMAAVAKNPDFAKKAGVPSSVGSDFIKADKGRTFGKGGKIMAKPMPMFGGKESYAEEMKEAKAIKSGKITPQQYAKAEGKEKTKPKQTSFAIGGAIPSFGRFGSAGRYSPPPPAAGRFDAAGKYSPPTPAAGRFSSSPTPAPAMQAPNRMPGDEPTAGRMPPPPMSAAGSNYAAEAARAAQMREYAASPPPQLVPTSPTPQDPRMALAQARVAEQKNARFGRGAPPPPTMQESQGQEQAMARAQQGFDQNRSAEMAAQATLLQNQYGKSPQASQTPQAADQNPNNQYNPQVRATPAPNPNMSQQFGSSPPQNQMNRPAPAFKKGGFIKSADGVASKGKTKAQQFSSGGRVSSRADGIATKGKTRGKMC